MSATPEVIEYEIEDLTVEEIQAAIATALADPKSYEQVRPNRTDSDPTPEQLAKEFGAAPGKVIGVRQTGMGTGGVEVIVISFATTFAVAFAKALAPVAAEMVRDVWKGIVFPRLLGKGSIREKKKK